MGNPLLREPPLTEPVKPRLLGHWGTTPGLISRSRCMSARFGKPIEGSWRSHQVPFADAREDDGHRRVLEGWLRSYRPQELFDAAGAPVPAIRDRHPGGSRQMSASPHANGGEQLGDLRLPGFRSDAVDVDEPGTGSVEATRVLGTFLRDVMRHTMDSFRLFSPDENSSKGRRRQPHRAHLLPRDRHPGGVTVSHGMQPIARCPWVTARGEHRFSVGSPGGRPTPPPMHRREPLARRRTAVSGVLGGVTGAMGSRPLDSPWRTGASHEP